jgi:transposase
MECYVGLDVHSKASGFLIQDGGGQVLAQGELPTTPEGFRRWYEAQHLPAGTPVALETGTVAFCVARELTGLGCVPIVVDAREVRLKAHRPTQKSDRRDAFELCDGLRRGIHRAIVHVPPRPVARLRETLATYRPNTDVRPPPPAGKAAATAIKVARHPAARAAASSSEAPSFGSP